MAVAGGLVVVPVAEHHAVAARAQLAPLADRHHLARRRIDDLDLHVRMHLADRADLLGERRADARLRADRARLGHAVGDRHLAHVHQRLDLLHHLDRARRAGHDAGAQRRQVVAREVGMVQLGDEHRRHAVERGGPLGLRGLQHRRGVEAVARIDHGGAVGHAAEVAHHHAEAVVERHRDDQPVPVGEAQQLGGEVAVVEDVVVAERGALGIAGGAAGVLDVDRIVELLLPLPPGQLVGADPLGHRQQRAPAEHPRRRLVAQPDDAAQARERGRRAGRRAGWRPARAPARGASRCSRRS